MATMEATTTTHSGQKIGRSVRTDREKLMSILRRNQALFVNGDSTFSPDRFDALKLLLLRDFDAECFNVVSKEFLGQLRAVVRLR